MASTGISSEIRTKLRDWAVWQARAGCYSQSALSSNDSKTLYCVGDREVSFRLMAHTNAEMDRVLRKAHSEKVGYSFAEMSLRKREEEDVIKLAKKGTKSLCLQTPACILGPKLFFAIKHSLVEPR